MQAGIEICVDSICQRVGKEYGVMVEIKRYTKDRIPDVLDFERRLRDEENFWGWKIDQAYVSAVVCLRKREMCAGCTLWH